MYDIEEENYYKEVGKKLRKARENAQLSQEEVAQMIHSTNQKVSSFETGRTRVSLDTLAKLCEIYNISIDSTIGIDKPLSMSCGSDAEQFKERVDIVFKTLLDFYGENETLSKVFTIAKDDAHALVELLKVMLAKIDISGQKKDLSITLYPLLKELPQFSVNTFNYSDCSMHNSDSENVNVTEEEQKLIKNYRRAAPADRTAVDAILGKYGEVDAK